MNCRSSFTFKLLTVFFLTSLVFLSAQTIRDEESLFLEAKNLLYKNPSESASIAAFIYKNNAGSDDKIQALMLLAEAYLIQGDYQNAVDKMFQSSELVKQLGGNRHDDQMHFLWFRICDELGVRFSQLYLIKGQKMKAPEHYSRAVHSFSQSKWTQTIVELDAFRKQKIKPTADLSDFFYALSYNNLSNTKAADYYVKKIRSYTPYFAFAKAEIQFSEKEFSKSLDSLNFQISDPNTVQDIALRQKIYSLFTRNHKELGDIANYTKSFHLENALQDSLSEIKENARILLLTKINQEQDLILKKKYDQQKKIIAFIVFFIILVPAVTYIVNKKVNRKKLQLQNRIAELEDRKRLIAEYNTQGNAGKILIPDKTVKLLLQKLENFEKNEEYLKKEISLQLLAEYLNTNTKYLSEIINTYKDKNFYAYINELRVTYIINQLKNNSLYLKYKVSHLAEMAGFSSHSLFSTVFKQVTGLSPASFIKSIKDNKDAGN